MSWWFPIVGDSIQFINYMQLFVIEKHSVLFYIWLILWASYFLLSIFVLFAVICLSILHFFRDFHWANHLTFSGVKIRPFTYWYLNLMIMHYLMKFFLLWRVSRWYCLYFVLYVLLGVYFVTNLILAVVYDSFKGEVRLIWLFCFIYGWLQ